MEVWKQGKVRDEPVPCGGNPGCLGDGVTEGVRLQGGGMSHLYSLLRRRITPNPFICYPNPFTTCSPFSQTQLPLTSHVPGIPDTWNYLPVLEFMSIFALLSLYLLFPFPPSRPDKCVLRALAGPQDCPCPWPPSFPLLPLKEILDSPRGS